MDLVANYGDDDDDDTQPVGSAGANGGSSSVVGVGVNAAPNVATHSLLSHQLQLVDPTARQIAHNPLAHQMWQPVLGPANPYTKHGLAIGEYKNMLTGYVEPAHFDDAAFREQYHMFIHHGQAVNPTHAAVQAHLSTIPMYGQQMVGAAPVTGAVGASAPVPEGGAAKSDVETRKAKRRLENRDPSKVHGFAGSWARPAEEDEVKELTDEQKVLLEEMKQKKAKQGEFKDVTKERSTFHGDFEKDYQGRPWIAPPADLDTTVPENFYVPKKLIHTWSGHDKGVNAIRFFPKTGHLLLSASMDSTCKIWGVNAGNRKCLRTYDGHSLSVRDICFSNDGTRFVSASYDKYVKVWDTETGKCLSRHTTGKIPYCVKLHPEKQNECLVGQENKKIIQYDLNSGEILQEYDEHLGAVNTVSFIDDNRRFVSTSDDKKVFIWEYGIPVVIKHLAEPEMHSMPYVEVHPSGKYFLGQSQDNQILVYSSRKGFKLNKKKRFLGHFNAGYACQISFSPDGKYVVSGDGHGRCFFWDWKTSRIFKRLNCHDKVTIGCIWHPLETSKVATCSWDGTIKYWD